MSLIRKLNIISFAKFQALLFALMGLVAGILYSFGGLIIDLLVSLGWVVTSETPGLSYGTLLAFFALAGMPLIFACAGFIAGLVQAVLYNFVASKFGSLHVDLE
jgi:hypothetical protein